MKSRRQFQRVLKGINKLIAISEYIEKENNLVFYFHLFSPFREYKNATSHLLVADSRLPGILGSTLQDCTLQECHRTAGRATYRQSQSTTSSTS